MLESAETGLLSLFFYLIVLGYLAGIVSIVGLCKSCSAGFELKSV